MDERIQRLGYHQTVDSRNVQRGRGEDRVLCHRLHHDVHRVRTINKAQHDGGEREQLAVAARRHLRRIHLLQLHKRAHHQTATLRIGRRGERLRSRNRIRYLALRASTQSQHTHRDWHPDRNNTRNANAHYSLILALRNRRPRQLVLQRLIRSIHNEDSKVKTRMRSRLYLLHHDGRTVNYHLITHSIRVLSLLYPLHLCTVTIVYHNIDIHAVIVSYLRRHAINTDSD